MLLRFYLGPDLLDFPLWIDEIGNAMDTLVFLAHEFLWAPRAIGLNNFLVLVRDQPKGQAIFRHKLVVLGRGIAAHPKQHGFCLLELDVFITERAGLLRSARRVVLGVKEQHHVFAHKLLKGNLATPVGRGGEGRSGIAFLECDIWTEGHDGGSLRRVWCNGQVSLSPVLSLLGCAAGCSLN